MLADVADSDVNGGVQDIRELTRRDPVFRPESRADTVQKLKQGSARCTQHHWWKLRNGVPLRAPVKVRLRNPKFRYPSIPITSSVPNHNRVP